MLKRAFKQTISGGIGKFLFGSAGALIAILLLGKNAFGLSLVCSVIAGILGSIGLFLLVFLFFIMKNTVVFIHDVYVDSIWGKAIIDINTINAQVQFLRKNGFTNEEFMRLMIILCDRLKEIFDRKTKANCGVSIKIPVFHEGESLESLEFKNLCRDSAHYQRDTRIYSETRHTVVGNTPYSTIFNKINNGSRPLHYINNDISNSKDYLNTSKFCYPDGKLPYNSELVYPILPMIKSGNENLLLGFICVDCVQTNVFDDSRYDIPVISGIADSIYDIILLQNNK